MRRARSDATRDAKVFLINILLALWNYAQTNGATHRRRGIYCCFGKDMRSVGNRLRGLLLLVLLLLLPMLLPLCHRRRSLVLCHANACGPNRTVCVCL